jgi:hypothetical protein
LGVCSCRNGGVSRERKEGNIDDEMRRTVVLDEGNSVNGTTLNKRSIPDLPQVKVLTSVARLLQNPNEEKSASRTENVGQREANLEVVVKRSVEDGELLRAAIEVTVELVNRVLPELANAEEIGLSTSTKSDRRRRRE